MIEMAQKHLQEREKRKEEKENPKKYQNVTDKSGQTKMRDDNF